MKKTLLLPLGFELKTEEYSSSLENGINMLGNHAIFNAVEAWVVNDKVLVKTQHWRCPYCTGNVSVLGKYSIDAESLREKYFQSSLFRKERELLFSNLFDKTPDVLKCPYCNASVHKNSLVKEITLEKTNNVITLSDDVNYLQDLLDIGFFDGDVFEYVSKLPLKKTVTLDFDSSQIFLTLEDSLGKALYETELIEISQDSSISNFIDTYYEFKECLYDMLFDIWDYNLFPFEANEINSTLLTLLVKFTSYPKSFYYKLPFELGKNKVFKTFEPLSKEMGSYEQLSTVLEKSNLPNSKSIRKVFYEEPSLFFYLKEIEKLMDLFKCSDHLIKIITSNNRYLILAYLHIFSGVFGFMKDYLTKKHATLLVNDLVYDPKCVVNFSASYTILRDDLKEQEVSTYHKDNLGRRYLVCNDINIPFSIPINNVDLSLDCDVEGYDFAVVKNTNDYYIAGVMLNNCLVNYDISSNPVVCVKKKKNYVAAIELDRDKNVVQAYARNNEFISEYPELEKVILKYFELNDFDNRNIEEW